WASFVQHCLGLTPRRPWSHPSVGPVLMRLTESSLLLPRWAARIPAPNPCPPKRGWRYETSQHQGIAGAEDDGAPALNALSAPTLSSLRCSQKTQEMGHVRTSGNCFIVIDPAFSTNPRFTDWGA